MTDRCSLFDGRTCAHVHASRNVGKHTFHLAVVGCEEVEYDVGHKEGVDKHAARVHALGGRGGRFEGGAEGYLWFTASQRGISLCTASAWRTFALLFFALALWLHMGVLNDACPPMERTILL